MTAVGIDIGGTFTDVVVMHDDGSLRATKAPTTPGRLLDGLMVGLTEAAVLEGQDPDTMLASLDRIAHGTTAATNAYIERRGAKVALITTRGFEDTIIMQRMQGMTAGLSTSELTDYSKRKVPEPLVPRSRIFGIRERVDYAGDVIGPLVEEDVRTAAAKIRELEVESVAVVYLWSFKNPAHEARTAQILAEELPGLYVSVSHELVPRLGEYERTATTVVNAYLGPMVRRYTDVLQDHLGTKRLFLLDSSGGVMTPAEAGRAPVRLLLSGPSGGVTAARFLGTDRGQSNVITFDMGGTSTDVALIDQGEALQRRDTVAEKYHLLLPMVNVRAIGAGGGSIARVEDGGYLRVGPESAGAAPGPACYGRGGQQPTVTDADVVLGIIDPERFLGGKLDIDVELARQAIHTHVATPLNISIDEAAVGIKRIVDTRMADLLRTVTVEQGYDPRDFVLYAFGGAGGTHAPAFALDVVDEIYVPSNQSVFCAVGAVASDVALAAELAVPMRLSRKAHGTDVDPDKLEKIFQGLEDRANNALEMQGVPPAGRKLRRLVEVRFIRQLKTISVGFFGTVGKLLDDFLAAYARRYGEESVPETAGFELVTFVVEAVGSLPRPSLARYPIEGNSEQAEGARCGTRRAYDAGQQTFVETTVYSGPDLRPGNGLTGPAIIEYDGTTVALLSGQTASVDELLGISIRKVDSASSPSK